jgi:hypothetical protein
MDNPFVVSTIYPITKPERHFFEICLRKLLAGMQLDRELKPTKVEHYRNLRTEKMVDRWIDQIDRNCKESGEHTTLKQAAYDLYKVYFERTRCKEIVRLRKNDHTRPIVMIRLMTRSALKTLGYPQTFIDYVAPTFVRGRSHA